MEVIGFVRVYGMQLSAIGAAIAFIFAMYKFQAERSASQFWKEFEAYHGLVKQLVQPPNCIEGLYIDRQTAILYELKFYKRYYPHSLRMLEALHSKWEAFPNQFPRLLEELRLTIKHIKKNL